MRTIFLAISICAFSIAGNAKGLLPDSLNHRRALVWSVNTGTPVVVFSALYTTWYKGYGLQKFHWQNDNSNWLQMDKAGHAFSAYFLTINSAASFRWAGYPKRKSALLGAAVALGFQTTIEYFDGRSPEWGASSGDLIANTVGSVFGAFQAYKWGKVKIPMRITFRTTALASIRPELLGSNLPERLLKDYNGQTYWLDFNPQKLGLNLGSKWPKWLGLGLGYGAEGMVGGTDNIWTTKNGQIEDFSNLIRYRQFFISPSLSLGHLKTKYKWLNLLFKLTDYWRVPMPTFEWNTIHNPRFRLIYW